MTLASLVSSVSLKADLVARYQFDNTSSSIVYNTARSGSLNGGATKVYDATRASKVLSCIGFQGSHVSLGDFNPSEGTNELTITAWGI